MKQTLQESRWVGRVLRDKWRIDSKIARGGMGTVFAATHKNNGARAAIKVLHPEFARDPDTQSRFLQEGYAANQVGHPGVVRILDDDVTEEGLAYLVMELLEGELLEQRRIDNGGKLPVDEVLEVGDQLLEVMVAAHAKGIIHRDIKPDNIFVLNDGNLKVLDFGFARMRDGTRTEQTATGFLLGTPGFMAPEQAIGNREHIDARTDVWAVGATLFVLLTGQPVHEGETAAEMLVAAGNFPVRPVGELEPGVPVKLRQVVDRALAFDRNARWPDAKSMQLALRAAPGRRPSPASEDEGRTLMRPSPSASVHEDRTVMGRVEELSPDVLESVYTPTSPLLQEAMAAVAARHQIHPADQEQHTLALDPDGPTMAAKFQTSSSTQKVSRYQAEEIEPEDYEEPEPSDHTVMMQARPRGNQPVPTPNQPAPTPTPRGNAPVPTPTPRGNQPVPTPTPRGNQPVPTPTPRGNQPVPTPRGNVPLPTPTGPQLPPTRQSYPDPPYPIHPPTHPMAQPMGMPSSAPMMQAASALPMAPMAPIPPHMVPPMAPRPETGGGSASTVLVFIAVAGITMVVVILTGLLVILGTE